ncbi:MAG: hypothetical protein U0271_09610 [Polyangiaceae bacterium]
MKHAYRPRRYLALAMFATFLLACGDEKPSASSASGTAKSTGSAASARASGATSSAPGSSGSSAPASASAPSPAAPPSDVPDKLEGANIDMNDVEANGFKMKHVVCKAPNANPFAVVGLLAPLAKQKPTFEGCSAAPTTVRVAFTIKDKKATDIKVAGAPDAAAAACIGKGIEAATWVSDLTCVVEMTAGKP